MIIRMIPLLCALLLAPRFPTAGGSGTDELLAERVHGLAEAFLAEDDVDGLSLVMAIGSDVLIQDGWGYAEPAEDRTADASSLYRAGALSPQFVTVLLLDLAEKGVLDLDDPVSKYLTELDFGAEPVTIHNVLSHTSGLATYVTALDAMTMGKGGFDTDAVLAWVAGEPRESAPGTCFAYSETNELLAGLVLEQVTEKSVRELVTTRLLESLGMDDSLYCWDGPSIHEQADASQEFRGELVSRAGFVHPFAAEGLCTTATDLLRFQRALVERELLGNASYELMTNSVRLEDATETGYGYGVNVRPLDHVDGISYGGGMAGGSVHVAHYPAYDLTVVVLASSEGTSLATFERAVSRLVLDVPNSELRDLPLTDEERGRYAGEYYVGCLRMSVEVGDEHLVFRPQIGSVHELLYQGDHEFVSTEDSGMRFTFVVEGDGPATTLILDDHGSRVEARRQ